MAVVATSVTYPFSFPYSIDSYSGQSYPGLAFEVSLPDDPEASMFMNAYLDSGAELSVFDGGLIVPFLNLDLMAGPEVNLRAATGVALSARIHRVNLSHPQLGRFTLDAAISTVPIRHNLLGRDFFQHLQIGFREFHHTFLIANAP
jgi:hypothetical protein